MRVIARIGTIARIGVMARGYDKKQTEKLFISIFARGSGLSHPCDNPDPECPEVVLGYSLHRKGEAVSSVTKVVRMWRHRVLMRWKNKVKR